MECTDPPVPSTETTEQEAGLSGVPFGNIEESNTDLVSSAADVPLAGVPPSTYINADEQTLPDLVLNRVTATNDINTTATAPQLPQDLEAASVLLSLHDEIRDDTLDEADEDDNTALMPIGGTGTPTDVAPQEIKLDQPNVDAAIAEIVQNELNQEETEPACPTEQQTTNLLDQHREQSEQKKQNLDEINTTEKDSKTENDVPDSEPRKGFLRMKGYGLK